MSVGILDVRWIPRCDDSIRRSHESAEIEILLLYVKCHFDQEGESTIKKRNLRADVAKDILCWKEQLSEFLPDQYKETNVMHFSFNFIESQGPLHVSSRAWGGVVVKVLCY
jgi:hypothetical protein